MSIRTLSPRRSSLPSFFNDFFEPWNDWLSEHKHAPAATMPKVNITEDDNGFNLSLAAPGLKKTDFKISIDHDTLTVSAESEKSSEEKKENFTREEYNYSSFSRSFALPENVKKDKISATDDGGILKLTLPKNDSAAAKPQLSIDVQ